MSVKELRREAIDLEIGGWWLMSPTELAEAVAHPELYPPIPEPTEGPLPPVDRSPAPVNPFGEGTRLWHVAEALMRGGTRQELITELLPLLDIRSQSGYSPEFLVNMRISGVTTELRLRDWEIQQDGRGLHGYVKAHPPEGKA